MALSHSVITESLLKNVLQGTFSFMEHKLYYFLFHFFFFRLGINLRKKHRAFASLFFTADTSVLKSRFMFHFSSWIEPKQQRNYFLSLSFIINLVWLILPPHNEIWCTRYLYQDSILLTNWILPWKLIPITPIFLITIVVAENLQITKLVSFQPLFVPSQISWVTGEVIARWLLRAPILCA